MEKVRSVQLSESWIKVSKETSNVSVFVFWCSWGTSNQLLFHYISTVREIWRWMAVCVKLVDILCSVVCPQAVHSITETGGGEIYTERFVLFIVECVIYCLFFVYRVLILSQSRDHIHRLDIPTPPSRKHLTTAPLNRIRAYMTPYQTSNASPSSSKQTVEITQRQR